MNRQRHTTRRLLAALGLIPVLGSTSSSLAIITYGSGDPTHNTTAPTGTLANSGWQWEGQWAGGFLGTAIAPQYFISAAHLGGSLGEDVCLGDRRLVPDHRVSRWEQQQADRGDGPGHLADQRHAQFVRAALGPDG